MDSYCGPLPISIRSERHSLILLVWVVFIPTNANDNESLPDSNLSTTTTPTSIHPAYQSTCQTQQCQVNIACSLSTLLSIKTQVWLLSLLILISVPQSCNLASTATTNSPISRCFKAEKIMDNSCQQRRRVVISTVSKKGYESHIRRFPLSVIIGICVHFIHLDDPFCIGILICFIHCNCSIIVRLWRN